MGMGGVHGAIHNVLKQFLAHRFQKGVLGFKMGIEGAAADVRHIQDFLHRDVAVALLFQQGAKGHKNGRPGHLQSTISEPLG